MSDSFPRQYARTQRFTLGVPRDVKVSPDGRRVVFLRSSAGDDPVNALWEFDVEKGEERLVADPRALLGLDDPATGELTDSERARRERMRDGATGITAYATDGECRVAAFALNGELFTAGLVSGTSRRLPVEGPVHDPRPDPTARRVAYVSGATLRVADLDGTSRVIAGNATNENAVSWGGADFIAAEEMHRFRGYWWSPDGEAIAVCRVDDGPVAEWTIADPAEPGRAARTVRYPAAGTDNPSVSLHIVGIDGSRVDVDWDGNAFPYLATVDWSEQGLLISVQSRDQRRTSTMTVNAVTGVVTEVANDADDAWVENVPGAPRLTDEGAVLTASDRDGLRRLYVDGNAITPTDLQVRSVVAATGDEVVYLANALDAPTELQVWSTTRGRLSESAGIHGASVGGPTTVLRSTSLEGPGATHTVMTGGALDGPQLVTHAEVPTIAPSITLLRAGDRELSTAVLLPSGRDPEDDAPLPVLLDPYGGPHAQRVTTSYNSHLSSQWFADQGYAVIVSDGRGTAGRGAAWERSVRHDLSNPPLDDQIDALHACAERFPMLDLDRVAIRGWSFGGFLAALAVLRRPDVFHAAIAGAPVTEWRLYDTHYTERYLGDPTTSEGASTYDANSLLPLAAGLERPLLLIHGLADDNVVAAHTLQMSSALLAAGRPHEVLPLVGVTHMTPQEVVAENLLLHQVDFLARALARDLTGSTQ
nr:prolyl oligopeptidase family serine peptidase [Ilumatobacter nonamiensis]